MRIATVATGGVGGYLGAKLIETGHEVAMLARGAHLDTIRADGLTVETNKGTLNVRPALASAEPAEIGPVDVVIFAVKLRDTEVAAEACRPLIGPDTVVIPFQNGVESSQILADILGAGHVAAGCTYIAISITGPGRLTKVGDLERFLFDEADGTRSERIELFRHALTEAGVNAPVPEDIHVEIWRKFAFLAPFSGLTAAARAPIGVVRSDDVMRETFRRAVAEVTEIARARSIGVPEDLVDQHMQLIDGLEPHMTASQAHDLAAGKPLEVEGLSGAVMRLGAQAGIDTPVHTTLLSVLRPFAGGAPVR